jgi:hypothetical protein
MTPPNGTPERASVLIGRIDEVIRWMDGSTERLAEIMREHPETTDLVHDVLSAYARPVILMRSIRRHLEAQVSPPAEEAPPIPA